MTDLPLWVYPLASAFACCLLLAGLLRWGERPRGIDMTALTDDAAPADRSDFYPEVSAAIDEAVDLVWEPMSHLRFRRWEDVRAERRDQ